MSVDSPTDEPATGALPLCADVVRAVNDGSGPVADTPRSVAAELRQLVRRVGRHGGVILLAGPAHTPRAGLEAVGAELPGHRFLAPEPGAGTGAVRDQVCNDPQLRGGTVLWLDSLWDHMGLHGVDLPYLEELTESGVTVVAFLNEEEADLLTQSTVRLLETAHITRVPAFGPEANGAAGAEPAGHPSETPSDEDGRFRAGLREVLSGRAERGEVLLRPLVDTRGALVGARLRSLGLDEVGRSLLSAAVETDRAAVLDQLAGFRRHQGRDGEAVRYERARSQLTRTARAAARADAADSGAQASAGSGPARSTRLACALAFLVPYLTLVVVVVGLRSDIPYAAAITWAAGIFAAVSVPGPYVLAKLGAGSLTPRRYGTVSIVVAYAFGLAPAVVGWSDSDVWLLVSLGLACIAAWASPAHFGLRRKAPQKPGKPEPAA